MRPLFLFLSLLILVGCHSFNSYQTNDVLVVENKNTPKTSTSEKRTCGVYKLPEIPPIPPIPLEEINKHSKNLAAIDAINIRHIRELRAHIRELHTNLNNSYQNYLRTCEN